MTTTTTTATATLTPGQLAARKAVETRRARLATVTQRHDDRRHEDARIVRAMAGDRSGYLLHVAGIWWSFDTRAALDRYVERSGFNIVADVQ
jgi:hypothetical protein